MTRSVHLANRPRTIHVYGIQNVEFVRSYADNLEDMRTLFSFRSLRVTCQRHDVNLVLSTMSMTGGINVGIDAFSTVFACDALIVK